jgi:hypothetical protein
VAYVQPATLEDVVHLVRENVGLNKNPPVDSKLVRAVDDLAI